MPCQNLKDCFSTVLKKQHLLKCPLSIQHVSAFDTTGIFEFFFLSFMHNYGIIVVD